MLIWGPRSEQLGYHGDEVTQRVVQFGSQEEQIHYLRSVVEEYSGVHAIVSRARDIVFRQRCCAPKDKRAQALAIASWVQDNITYVEEIPERFQTPTSTIAQGYGDCDDFVTVIGSLLQAIGIEVELVAMHWAEADGAYYRHIFVRAVFTERGEIVRLPLDATMSRPVYDLVDPIEVAKQSNKPLRLLIA